MLYFVDRPDYKRINDDDGYFFANFSRDDDQLPVRVGRMGTFNAFKSGVLL